MKVLIHSITLSGSYDDDDFYYLMFDEEKGEYYVQHEYHHWRPTGVRQGKDRISLDSLKRIEGAIYEKAIAEIQRIEEQNNSDNQ